MSRCIPPLLFASKTASLPPTSPAFAAYLDAQDPLAPLRAEYIVTGEKEGGVYFSAHALGAQPRRVKEMLVKELETWDTAGCQGHTTPSNGWTINPSGPIDQRHTSTMASLVGALPSELVFMGGLTSNLHILLSSFYRPDKEGEGRWKIICEEGAFPSDMLVFQSQIHQHHLPPSSLIRIPPRPGQALITTEDILATIALHGATTSIVLLPAVHWYTGQFFEMEKITRAAKAAGCLVGWDCAHAAGNVPMQLHSWGVDFAAWCTYKYLSAGPGATACVFVHEDHFKRDRPQGWWGTELDIRFTPGLPFTPRGGAAGFALSNPSVLATVPLHASLSIIEQIPLLPGVEGRTAVEVMREKSVLLTGLLECLLTSPEVMRGTEERIKIISPSSHTDRGSCLSVEFLPPPGIEDDGTPDVYSSTLNRVYGFLADKRCVTDKRAPRMIRFSPSPMYNGFGEVWGLVRLVREALEG